MIKPIPFLLKKGIEKELVSKQVSVSKMMKNEYEISNNERKKIKFNDNSKPINKSTLDMKLSVFIIIKALKISSGVSV